MRYRTIVLTFFLLLSNIGFAQSVIDSLYEAIAENNANRVSVLFEKIEKNCHNMRDEEQSDFLYLKGIYLEKSNNINDALECFRKSMEISKAIRRYNQTYYDAVLRTMLRNNGKTSYYECVKFGFDAINSPTQNQREYPNMHRIYSALVAAMLRSGLYADIPYVAEKGNPIIREQVNAADEEYYSMPFGEAMAWLLMGNAEKAEEIYETFSHEKAIPDGMRSSLVTLHQEIARAKEEKWSERKVRRFQQIEEIGDELLPVSPETTEGSILWRDYFAMIRNSLEHFHFDATDAADEALWTLSIANMIVRFFVQCDDLPERESVEYDNILCRKNFLNYHYGFHREKPTTWREIQEALNEDEVAIEISCVPEDILIIKKNEPLPICLSIDSLLFDELVMLDNNDAVSIDKYYSPNGALAKMWRFIESALEPNIHTIFISGSNFFSEINYGAIASEKGTTVSDNYNMHVMLCTSDIIAFKQNERQRYKNACLIGGVDYKESKPQLDEKNGNFRDAEWNLSKALPQNMRSGFRYLPSTFKEVNDIKHIMDSIGIACSIRTGKEATEEFFKSNSSQSPDIVHIATHGFMLAPLFNDSTAQGLRADLGTQYQTVLSQSGLLLAGANNKWEKNARQKNNDGILTSQEIADLNLSNTSLAVLTACKSGLGGTTNLTGVPFGVAYAFRMAGVRQILCCLWDVEDEVTSAMIKSFYRYLFETSNAKKALELARKELVTNGYTSPYYWAPFILIE